MKNPGNLHISTTKLPIIYLISQKLSDIFHSTYPIPSMGQLSHLTHPVSLNSWYSFRDYSVTPFSPDIVFFHPSFVLSIEGVERGFIEGSLRVGRDKPQWTLFQPPLYPLWNIFDPWTGCVRIRKPLRCDGLQKMKQNKEWFRIRLNRDIVVFLLMVHYITPC